MRLRSYSAELSNLFTALKLCGLRPTLVYGTKGQHGSHPLAPRTRHSRITTQVLGRAAEMGRYGSKGQASLWRALRQVRQSLIRAAAPTADKITRARARAAHDLQRVQAPRPSRGARGCRDGCSDPRALGREAPCWESKGQIHGLAPTKGRIP